MDPHDKPLIFHSKEQPTHLTEENKKAITYIEKVFEKIIHEAQRRPNGNPSISINRIIALKSKYDKETLRLEWEIEHKEDRYRFPGKSQDEAWKFVCISRILKEIYGAIQNGIIITKRDIFYRDPELFKRQSTVDKYVNNIAHTCQVSRKGLNVTASPRGLIAGYRSDEIETIPDGVYISSLYTQRCLKWILVVEKETIFKYLAESKVHTDSIIGPGIIITARGYPDLATKHFLRSLIDNTQLQTFGLFDCDPYGIHILKCYRFGSKSLAREFSYDVPELKWIGVQIKDIIENHTSSQGLMTLNLIDRQKARQLLAKPEWQDADGKPLQEFEVCRLELQQMLFLNLKAEIELLHDRPGGLVKWLLQKLTLDMC